MNKAGLSFLFIVLTIVAIVIGCHSNTSTEVRNTASSGTATFSIDETVGPIIKEEKFVFEHTFPEANITLQFKPENDAIEDLQNKKVQLIVISRKLEDAELATFKNAGYTPQQLLIAYDGLAFIVNNTNTDTTVTEQKLVEILKGALKNWKEVNETGQTGEIRVVFDNSHSGTVSYIARQILKGQPMPANSYAMKTSAEVMSYVANTPNAIGVLGVNWISNREDSATQEALKTFKVVGISSADNPGNFTKPDKQNITWSNYPFKREIYLINSETYTGLGTGFASFIASDKGQTIIKRAGLSPAVNSLRMIEIKSNF